MIKLPAGIQGFAVPVIFVSMKRTFPAIIILISLSLLGLIMLQTSWLKNLLELTESQLNNKVEEAGANVSIELSKTVYNNQLLRLPRRGGGLTFSSDFHLHLLKPPSVEEKFTPQQVYVKIKSACEEKGRKDLKFEVAVTNTTDDVEMYNKDFDKDFGDKIKNNRK